MTVSVSVANRANESAIKNVIESVHAEIVNIPKFLEAYPSLGRFPTRFEHTNLSALEAPAICYIANPKKAFERQVMQSWFINFSEETINGVAECQQRISAIKLDVFRAMTNIRPTTFRADPSDEDFHLLDAGKGIHLFLCSNPANGDLLKLTIIRLIPSDTE